MQRDSATRSTAATSDVWIRADFPPGDLELILPERSAKDIAALRLDLLERNSRNRSIPRSHGSSRDLAISDECRLRAKRSAETPDDRINFTSFITSRVPVKLEHHFWNIFRTDVPNSTASYDVTRGRRRRSLRAEGENPRKRGEAWRTFSCHDYARGYMALCAEIYVSGDTFLSA